MRQLISKLIISTLILFIASSAYAENNGTIKVTNQCNDMLFMPSVQSQPSGLHCWGIVTWPQRVRIGKTVEFSDLDTQCNYNVIGGGPIVSVDFESGKKTVANLIYKSSVPGPGHHTFCQLYLDTVK